MINIQVISGIFLLFLAGTKSTSSEEVAEWSPPQNHPRQSENFGSEGQMTGGSSGSGRFFQTTNSLIAPTVASNQTPFDRQIANSWQQFPSEHGHMVTHNSRRGPTLGGPSGFVPHPGGLTGSIGQIENGVNNREFVEKLLREQFEMNHTAMAAARNINNAFKMDIIGERQAQRYFKEFRGGLPYERKKASGMRKTEPNVDSETIERLLLKQFKINSTNASKAARNINKAYNRDIVKERRARIFFEKFRRGTSNQTAQTKARSDGPSANNPNAEIIHLEKKKDVRPPPTASRPVLNLRLNLSSNKQQRSLKEFLQRRKDEAERKRKLLETGIDTSPIVFETADIHDDLLDQMLAAYSEHNPPMDSNGGGIGPVDVSDQQHQSQYHHYDHYGGYTQRQPQNPYNTIAYNGNTAMANINKRALNDALSAYPFLDSSNFTAHGTGELEHDGSSHSNKGKRQKLAVK